MKKRYMIVNHAFKLECFNGKKFRSVDKAIRYAQKHIPSDILSMGMHSIMEVR